MGAKALVPVTGAVPPLVAPTSVGARSPRATPASEAAKAVEIGVAALSPRSGSLLEGATDLELACAPDVDSARRPPPASTMRSGATAAALLSVPGALGGVASSAGRPGSPALPASTVAETFATGADALAVTDALVPAPACAEREAVLPPPTAACALAPAFTSAATPPGDPPAAAVTVGEEPA